MEGVIQLLPDAIANQIAAGEVVQRPASVVKELLENSIDAGSTSIELIVKEAGKSLIQIIDNGKGMSEADARMCFERHATSKLRTSEDLFKILTYGFRGEAMASIAAVAQVEMKTKQAQAELGTLVQIEGSTFKKTEPTAMNAGTIICIKNLFYNVPARRNFLKSNAVELKHIIEEFQRVALAYPHISMSLFQNDIELYQLPSGKLSQRIVSIFGKSYQSQLVAIEEETELVRIKGYIGKPESARKTRGEQFFFVNNRFIKHPYLNHAIVEAFDKMLGDKNHPFYCIFLEIDPKHVDVNVHPTKTEVKFDDERTLYAIVHAAAKQALGIHNITPTLDFDLNINLGAELSGKRDYGNEKPPFEVPAFSKSPSTSRQERNQQNWQELYQGFDTNHSKKDVNENHTLLTSAINQSETSNESLNDRAGAPFQLLQKYIAAKVKSGLILLDYELAHERIMYEKYVRYLDNNSSPSQQCLFPQTVELNPADFVLIHELKSELHKLGFLIEDFGKNAIIINGIPSDLVLGNEKQLVEDFLEQFKHYADSLKVDKKEKIARSLARRTCMKSGKSLTVTEQQTIIDQLFSCQTPNFAPNGQSTYVILGENDIKNLFA